MVRSLLICFAIITYFVACKADRNSSDDHVENDITTIDNKETVNDFNQFISSIINEFDTVHVDSQSNGNYKTYQLKKNEGSNDQLIIGLGLFQDSIKCASALIDWQKGHKVEGNMISFSESFSELAPEQLLLLKLDGAIIYMYSSCQYNQKDWIEVKDKLFSSVRGIRKRITFDCGGPLLEQSFCCL